MYIHLHPFLLHWLTTSLALWVASHLFRGVRFENIVALATSALLLGFVNAIVRPVLVLLTLPLTFVSFGFFLLVINALMIQLVSALVKGFRIDSFWTAFFLSIFLAVFSFVLGCFVVGDPMMQPVPIGGWI